MNINYNIKIYPVSWLVAQFRRGNLKTDISIQRKEVWDGEHKSNLITAALISTPIESLLFEDNEDKTFNVIDGKQRTLTFCRYTNDEFSLSPKIRIKEFEGEQLVGKRYSELSEESRNILAEFQLSIAITEKLDDQKRATLFFMRNQARPLSKIDLLPSMFGGAAMEDFDELCGHRFIKEKIKPTEYDNKMRNAFKMLLHFAVLISGENIGFSGNELIQFADDIQSGKIAIRKEDISETLSYMNEAIPMKMPYLKPVHTPMILYNAYIAKDNGVAPEAFFKKIEAFFLKVPKDYDEACKGSTAKQASVRTRLNSMVKFCNF
jgi:hypothetical protein